MRVKPSTWGLLKHTNWKEGRMGTVVESDEKHYWILWDGYSEATGGLYKNKFTRVCDEIIVLASGVLFKCKEETRLLKFKDLEVLKREIFNEDTEYDKAIEAWGNYDYESI